MTYNLTTFYDITDRSYYTRTEAQFCQTNINYSVRFQPFLKILKDSLCNEIKYQIQQENLELFRGIKVI